MRGFLSGLAEAFASFAFPPFCATCRQRMTGRRPGAICPDCWSESVRWGRGCCQRCGTVIANGENPDALPLPLLCEKCHIDGWSCRDVRCVGPFSGAMADAVHLLKYSDNRSLAGTIAGLMAETIGRDREYLAADMIVSVPLHPARKRERGYNQAQLLAEGLGRLIGIPAPDGLVVRTKHTATQTTMGREQRRRNVEDIFRAKRPEAIAGKTVILIDDVLTTGATIGACGQSLLNAGAQQVFALTAAAAPL